MAKRIKKKELVPKGYGQLLSGITDLLEQSRRSAARVVNSFLTATYWDVGQRIVEYEQGGKERAEYGEELLKRLGQDLLTRYGRGFSERNLRQMRTFYLEWAIRQTVSAEFEVRTKFQTPSGISAETELQALSARPHTPSGMSIADAFPLPWSHYVRLMAVKSLNARALYEEEAIRGGWTVRQLDRQIDSLFYERTALSKNKLAMLERLRYDFAIWHLSCPSSRASRQLAPAPFTGLSAQRH